MKEHEIYYDTTVAFRGMYQKWPDKENCELIASFAEKLFKENITKDSVGLKIIDFLTTLGASK